MNYDRMERLGIISDAEMELERIEKENKYGKSKPKKLFYYSSNGFIHEVKIGENKGSDRVINSEEIVKILNENLGR